MAIEEFPIQTETQATLADGTPELTAATRFFFWLSGAAKKCTLADIRSALGLVSNDPTLGGATPSATVAPSESATQAYVAAPAVNAQTGTTYTLQASDAGKVVTLTNAAAITVTCSGLANGSTVIIEQLGAGQVTLVTGTLTLRHVAALTKTAGIYSRIWGRVSGSNFIVDGAMS